MGQSKPRAAAARPYWLLLLCLAQAAIAGVMQARAQPDSNGFISIDCGLPGTTAYVDNTTKLAYAPDAAFTDAGENRNISAEYITPGLARGYHNVRSFPDGARNCYTLRSLTAGNKYLLRAGFMYGNYDGLDRPPVFDLHIGVNFWTTVIVSSSDTAPWQSEAIVVVPDNFVQVCLINTDSGTPFISGLSLRPLKISLYPQVNAMQGLVLLTRHNFGEAGDIVVRYPHDPYDRIWFPWFDATMWGRLSTTQDVRIDDTFEAPSKVMQTAITPRDASMNIEFSWDYTWQPKGRPSLGYIPIMYFSEPVPLAGNAVRQFYINIDGELWYKEGFTPKYLYSVAVYNTGPYGGSIRYNVSINATANSTLPPIINAVELFTLISSANVGTDSQDVSAITTIKTKYLVKKNWMGDPCVPRTYGWDGLTCSYAISDPARITGVNMSFSGLNGGISSVFANLKAVQYVDLSHNNLTGSIPDALSQLPSLTVLDLTGNQLSGSIPPGLLQRIQDGSLNLIYADNPNLCTDSNTCQTEKGKSMLAIYIAVPMALAVVIVLLFCLLLRRKKRESMNTFVRRRSETSTSLAPTRDEHIHDSLHLENRRFTYKDLERITNNFQRVIGRGGFGYVYEGFLEDGTQVAVKLRSQSSNQGAKEFLTEAQILTRVHHKNLVSMIGYCNDGKYMALVYEYMSEGTLQEHIAGKSLTWRQRLRIALESAQGLEYLHKGCNPPLIHRDVKTTNILLNAKLEAKVADFGLSRAFNHDVSTHISTNTLVGTPGYVDPEYQATMQPTTKSDVYSFSVVLLELITGKLPILHNPQPTSVIQWTRQHLARGDIEGVLDVCMGGDHDVNSAWKAIEVALQGTAQASTQRPTMTDVVAQLQECLALEEGCTGGNTEGSGDPRFGYSVHVADRSTDASQGSSAFEVDHSFGMGVGPAAR
ncbi:putative leucine-rich repeat receptor-like protein kinase At2g19210 isoform X4 [Panicum hallii]|uniref:putative leucine-rich repeat receptor-like protein kinase At2g19210 isoform X4 n=1 Tax=Panicum hallii TaxID=206008 RepID=UPI000DF4DD52|nr:putative leucine-rich repeat receptor-like protein kinase At2g19210 isoform X4 [Panicum hallii]